MTNQNKQQLGQWLLIILAVIYLQVIIGGITRLTESGLSMTDWNIVTGTIPPLTEAAWQAEFQQYQQSPEYIEVNKYKGMELAEFKQIFFWEWLHRVWGRLGFVFLLGVFAYFLIRKKLDGTAIRRFILVLILYLAQGVLGWVMVKSGLIDRPEVSHYRLTSHLLLAIFLFTYLLWFVNDLLVSHKQKVKLPHLQRMAWLIVGLMVLQIMFGGFMSGLKAATHYPTFPDMNGQWIPTQMFHVEPFWMNFMENIATIQFTHRSLAYLLVVLVCLFVYQLQQYRISNPILIKGKYALLGILALQVGLGISVLLTATDVVSVNIGVAHQAVGLLLLSIMLLLSFQFKSKY